MDRGAWWATVHGVAESRTRLNDNCIIVLWALSYYLAQSDIPLWNPSSGISRYSKEPWFLQLRVVFKSWDLGAKCAHCFCGATASRCGQSWGICVSTFMYVHTNIRIYLCLCLYSYIYIYMTKWVHTDTINFSTTGFMLFFSPLFVTYFSVNERPEFHFP